MKCTVLPYLAATMAGACIGVANPSMPGQPLARSAAGFIAIGPDTIQSPAGVRYRLLGYEAPRQATAGCVAELDAATAAKRRLQELIDASDSKARLEETGQQDDRGRVLAKLTIASMDVATILIVERLARPVDGRKRPGWCEVPSQ